MRDLLLIPLRFQLTITRNCVMANHVQVNHPPIDLVIPDEFVIGDSF